MDTFGSMIGAHSAAWQAFFGPNWPKWAFLVINTIEGQLPKFWSGNTSLQWEPPGPKKKTHNKQWRGYLKEKQRNG